MKQLAEWFVVSAVATNTESREQNQPQCNPNVDHTSH